MSRQKNLKRNLLICLLAGSAVMYTLPLHAATSVVANNALPQGGQFMGGSSGKFDYNNNGLELNVHQNDRNAVIKWGSFDVGGSATVNFTAADAFKNNFNTLNYVNSGSASQIYGTINGLGGNIYVVNTAGVQIGPSAQINVGSLYVSNNVLDDSVFNDFVANADNAKFDLGGNPTTYTDAALMSLGNINANNVTFEGNGRIVIDSERITNDANNATFRVNTNDAGNVLIGYDAYEETFNGTQANSYKGKDKIFSNVYENGSDTASNVKGYMWVEDVEQLQKINTNLGGNYALRNSIDATSTAQNKFTSIGSDNYAFTGNFDGIDYNIFGLNIDSSKSNTGLFGETNGATIRNVTLVGGKITGRDDTGALVGHAIKSTITNVVNSAEVNGDRNVGGLIGVATSSIIENAVNTGKVYSAGGDDYNSDIVSSVGGLIGSMYEQSKLTGNSYNLGDVSGKGYNVGGLVGHAVNSTIGNPSVVNEKPVENVQVVYNRLDVEGAYNVGGIVGNMEGTTVQNAENSGNVMATGYDTENYIYNTANTDFDKTHGENNDGVGGVEVNVANVGGIAGNSSNSSTIENVTNTGNVNSNTDTYEHNHTYYTAGNVGGVVGRAENTNITNATNRENEVRGAHNVGGVAGYFSGIGTVDGGINDGGDIMATGARAAAGVNGNVVNEAGFAREQVRPGTVGDETFIIGNMGGVVGYMDGDNVYVTGSANRGTVHSEDITDPGNILYISQAANTGGIVGKINRNKITDGEGNILTNEAILAGIKEGSITAAVTDSYNTGDVTGYSGVGGVVGMMYNGEVADSYNLGSINTTRKPKGGDRTSVNMGGVVGDTTEGSGASAVIYNVYNKGQIGDDDYETYARHVGGIVGRLSGIVDKSYNTGAIYNGYSVVGGIAGWFYEGTISNSFNTGNITVNNKETLNSGTQVGGIVGGIGAYNGSDKVNAIYNAYNLGTIRSFNDEYQNSPNNVGGIVGKVVDGGSSQSTAAKVEIKNVYTTSNIYSSDDKGAGSIYGNNEIGNRLTVDGANYIDLGNSEFTNLDNSNPNVNEVDYGNRYNSTAYNFVELNTGDKICDDVKGANVSEDAYWRIYKNEDGTGTTPILNAFLPNAEDYFSGETGAVNPMEGISSIQYGTAYDPLLTIIKANEDLTFDWGALGIQNDAGLAVYGYGVTLNNFRATGGTGYFGGTIYADGTLNLNGSSDIGLGSASQIYGSDVTIGTNGKVTIYGDVTATGNKKDNNDTTGSITINAGEVDVYGALTSAKKDQQIQISGIAGGVNPGFKFENITDKTKPVTNVGDRFAHEVTASETGNITINAGQNATGNGNVNLYYGNKQEGLITTGGNLTVTGEGDVYVDSDIAIGGNLTLEAGAGKEALLDITNIGQVQNNHDNEKAKETLHNFLDHFATNQISFGETQDAKITVDMWNGNTLDLSKFDYNGTTLVSQLNDLNVDSAGNKTAKQLTHIWVNNGEQLKNIQTADDKALDYNFALKGDINASDVENYVAIGTGSEFTGTFDGRGNRIIGLNVDGNNAGIFSTIGASGTVKNVNIYSSNFTGTDNAGAVAGVNNGRIENVTGFGNTVTSNGNAGGIVGENNGNKGNIITNEDGTITLEPAENEQFATGIIDVESIGSVIAKGDNAVAGGLVGTNEGALGNSYSDSAVTSTFVNNQAGLGGVVGVNTEKGNVQYVDSLGVTNGGTTGSSNVGGVIGINKGNMYSGYNESIVSGKDNVGGIIGTNSSAVGNVVNATSVSGKDETDISEYVGGLVGTNSGSVTNGRNNGTITGTNYVGGMVGNNADGSTLTNLVNDSSAAITGVQYVGGIAGKNDGIITANNSNLINRGSITGNQYVGGVAGMNTGEISNTVNSVVLNATGTDAKYFGGVAGYNNGVIGTVTNTSVIDVTAQYGTLVGGIIGFNDANGTLAGEIVNEGNISGESEVGGIIGENINQSILNNEGKPRLTISNKGNVRATNGGAAGIFYDNQGVINNVDLINEGTVTGGTAKDSVTGGLFGKNSGKVTNSILTNSGIVTGGGTVGGLIGDNSGSASGSVFTNDGIVEGEDKVGGLFGINSGSFNTSSLINTVNAQVTGKQEVGGLIGKNTGKIEGGRDAADSYYKYQIYNNGTITVTGEGENIGGLIGYNTKANSAPGSLTAGYNTGAIKAENSSNVGGIVGKNEGVVDQVFNTVMTENGTDAISGGTNVGGLVGTNSGTLSNAYNTTAVNGAEGSTGNAVGVNDGKDAKVNFVYDVTNTKNKLIGKNAGRVNGSYALQESGQVENAANGIAYISVKDKNDKGQYMSLTGSDWKFYDGQQTPLLSVFLTKVKIDQDKVNEYMSKNKVYNGTEQKLTADDIKALINNGAIYVEGLTQEQAFEAFCNNNDLISSVGHTNAGQYSDWLYSQQIASSGSGDTFNPNNLGYDIALTGDINKVKVDIDLNTIERIYGDTTILNNGDYGYSYEFTNADKKYEDVLKNQLKNVLDFAYSEDGALIIVNGEERTNNKGDYTYKGTLTLNSTNFEFVVDKGDSQTETSTSSTLTTYGTSIVHAKKINVDDFLATIVYGNKNNDFVITGIDEVIKDQLAYEEDVLDANLTDIKTIGDYEVIRDGRDTADVDTYYDSITANISINNGNYELTGSAADGTITGNVKVTPVQLDIVLGNVGHEYGSPNLDDYKASIGTNGLVNGDDGNVSIDVNKVVDDALKDNNKYTNKVDDYTWVVSKDGISANGFGLGNYIVTVTNEGKSEVTPAKLDIVLGDVSHKYGSPNLDDYKASIGTNGLVNGDNGNVSIDVNKVVDDALKDNNKYTNKVDDYTWVVSKDGISANGFSLGNYIVTVTNEGKSEVTPAKLNIKVDNANTTVGKMPGELTGTVEGLTNGDTLPTHDFALKDDSLISVSGNHENVIGIVIGGKFYELGDADWSNGLFANYDVNYEMGDLAVSVVEMPDNWPNNRWDYLFGDNPFDRNENFRERKAEVNFVDGAMEI